jgi:hypothetical protein
MNIEYYIQKAHQKGLFLTEDFKSMKAKYLQQGIDASIVDNYINTFKSIKDLKELNDDIQSFPIPKGNDRKNIDNYKDFHTLETIVDYVKGKRNIKTASFDNQQTSSNDETLSFPGNVVIKNDELEVKYADSPRACIEYKGKFPYSWCISRTDASNMFSTYRFKEHEPAFYFVKRVKATEKEFGLWNMTKNIFNGDFKDKYHFFVVQVLKNANVANTTQKQYIVTSAKNDGDIQMTWEDILKIAPELSGLQSKFMPIPLSQGEKETFDKYIKGISDEEFSKLDYKEKRNYLDIYVKMDKHLTDAQFGMLPDDLKGLYIGFGVPLSKGIFEFVMSNGKLKKRYDEILKRRFEEFLKGTEGIELGGHEVIYTLKNGLVDGDKLGADMVGNLLRYRPEEQRYELIQEILPFVNSSMIGKLLYHAPQKQKYELALQILSLVKDKLDDIMINNLLVNTPEEKRYDLIQQIFPLVKDKLDSPMIGKLLYYTPKEQQYELVKQIFPLVKNKLDGYIVVNLLYYTPKEKRYDDNIETPGLIQQILSLVKDNLDGGMIDKLLEYTPEEQRYDLIKQILPLVKGKLDGNMVDNLLSYTPYKQRYELVKQILPLVKDKLDSNMIGNLLYNTPKENEQEIQLLIDKYTQKDVINELRLIVRKILKENY